MSQNKVKSLSEVVQVARKARASGKKIVATNGCFDIIHSGHVKNLEWAKSRGDILIVGINSDKAIRVLKGRKRPIVPAAERAKVLAGLGAVDYVFIFNSKSPISWFKKVKPSLWVKPIGSEKHPDFTPEKEIIEANGGKSALSPKVIGVSTTAIIERILKAYR